MGTHGLGKEKEALANSQPSREVGGGGGNTPASLSSGPPMPVPPIG